MWEDQHQQSSIGSVNWQGPADRSKQGLTPLMVAAGNRSNEAVYVLLQARANPNTVTSDGRTALQSRDMTTIDDWSDEGTDFRKPIGIYNRQFGTHRQAL